MSGNSSDQDRLSSLAFTVHAREAIEKTTQDPYFRDEDPELMFTALMDEIKSVSFSDYLKRYILSKAPDNCNELDYLCEAFRKTGVPPSFSPTTSKIRALAKNWLTQRIVNRNIVLLLGFALEMTPDEVNGFLSKALKEQKIDPKDPFEVICWYCYQFRLPYSRFEELRHRTMSGKLFPDETSLFSLESTVHVRKDMESIRSEEQLMIYLSRLNLVDHSGRQSISARKQFDELYRKTCSYIAVMKTEIEKDNAELDAARFADSLSRSDRFFDYQKRKKVQKARDQYHRYTADEITPADLETALYPAIPKDRNGNMIPMKESLLNIQFSGKRLNRQHISDVLEGKGVINRFDIITLSFFVMAKETEESDDIQSRYDHFIQAANDHLAKGDMSPLYVANPYESFLLMCMLTDDPLGSFSDVWELSYEDAE